MPVEHDKHVVEVVSQVAQSPVHPVQFPVEVSGNRPVGQED